MRQRKSNAEWLNISEDLIRVMDEDDDDGHLSPGERIQLSIAMSLLVIARKMRLR